VFSEIHVLVAVNPSKQGTIDPMTRARIIASAVDPCTNWFASEPPFHINDNIIVATTPGLVVEYAGYHGIKHLVRGLRSTTDFEAEFNLYFSNRSIDSRIQTWAVLCPPELLHCSSTYVRSVVGNPSAKRVGTTFVAQCAMMKTPVSLGRIFDFIALASSHRFENESLDLDIGHLKTTLQGLFITLVRSEEKMKRWVNRENDLELDSFLSASKPILQAALELQEYPKELAIQAWTQIARGISEKIESKESVKQSLALLSNLGGTLGRTHAPLFDVRFADEIIRG
jgi:phosphopantetheine adenylyltransferase